jgi:transposase InsO family protein
VTAAGQRFRVLGVIDRFTRKCLALEVATSFPSRRVTRVLERAIAGYGKPQSIRSDNGPELTSRHYLAWAIDWKIDQHASAPSAEQSHAPKAGRGSG